jgi:hypothetical protein
VFRGAVISQAELGLFDGKGNHHVDGYDPNNKVIVGEFPHATSGGSTFEQPTTTNAIAVPGGIQVTTAGGEAEREKWRWAVCASFSVKLDAWTRPWGWYLPLPALSPAGR